MTDQLSDLLEMERLELRKAELLREKNGIEDQLKTMRARMCECSPGDGVVSYPASAGKFVVRTNNDYCDLTKNKFQELAGEFLASLFGDCASATQLSHSLVEYVWSHRTCSKVRSVRYVSNTPPQPKKEPGPKRKRAAKPTAEVPLSAEDLQENALVKRLREA